MDKTQENPGRNTLLSVTAGRRQNNEPGRLTDNPAQVLLKLKIKFVKGRYPTMGRGEFREGFKYKICNISVTDNSMKRVFRKKVVEHNSARIHYY